MIEASQGFNQRKRIGNHLENLVDDYLLSRNIKVIKTGYENILSQADVNRISKDSNALSLRYIPDRYLPDFGIYLEPINSLWIPREKYTHLMQNIKNCYIVGKGLLCAKVQDIKFEKPNDKCWGMAVPIIDTYWRDPEAYSETWTIADRFAFIEMSKAMGKPSSGKAHACFDWPQSNAKHITELIP